MKRLERIIYLIWNFMVLPDIIKWLFPNGSPLFLLFIDARFHQTHIY